MTEIAKWHSGTLVVLPVVAQRYVFTKILRALEPKVEAMGPWYGPLALLRDLKGYK